jgi:hypothetical protein
MKAKFEFDFNEPGDAMDHRRMTKALDMALVLWEIKNNAQKKIYDSLDYMEEDKPKTAYDGVEMVFEMLHQLMYDHSLNMDDLVE